MWSTEVQATEVLNTTTNNYEFCIEDVNTLYIIHYMYFLVFFLGSIMFTVALTLEIYRVLRASLSWLHSVNCILEHGKRRLINLRLGENKSVQVTNSENAEGKQLSPPP